MIHLKEALTYDDVLLVPQYSEVVSRDDVDPGVVLGKGIYMRIPIISANMKSVTWGPMAMAMAKAGCLGILHRFDTDSETELLIEYMRDVARIPVSHIVPSVGVKEHDLELLRKYADMGLESVCVDVAHGDSKGCVDATKLAHDLGYRNIIAGNIATPLAAQRLWEAGANILKVGVGPGSVCTTRLVTGHGYPQLSAVMEIADSLPYGVSLIADGGIKQPGDIVKALAAGADAVMLGYMLAGTDESNDLKVYRGSASRGNKSKYVEGVDVKIPNRGPLIKVLDEIENGIRSGMSYSGAKNLSELYNNAEFVKVTYATAVENGPHARMREE